MDEWSKKVGEKLQGYSYDKPLSEDKVQSFFDKREEATPVRSNSKPWMMMAAGLSFLILAGIGVFYSNNVSVTTGAGEVASLELPDGSTVELGYQSEISFNKISWLWSRNVDLEGEAYFEVEKGSKFSVLSSEGMTSVLGTKFNVYAQADAYTVECFEGKVQVESGDVTEQLEQGEGVDIRRRRPPVRYRTKRTSPGWKDGELYFDDVSIFEALAELERVYNVSISGKDKMQGRRYSGYFPTTDLGLALKLVFDPMEVEYTLKENQVTIR